MVMNLTSVLVVHPGSEQEDKVYTLPVTTEFNLLRRSDLETQEKSGKTTKTRASTGKHSLCEMLQMWG